MDLHAFKPISRMRCHVYVHRSIIKHRIKYQEIICPYTMIFSQKINLLTECKMFVFSSFPETILQNTHFSFSTVSICSLFVRLLYFTFSSLIMNPLIREAIQCLLLYSPLRIISPDYLLHYCVLSIKFQTLKN